MGLGWEVTSGTLTLSGGLLSAASFDCCPCVLDNTAKIPVTKPVTQSPSDFFLEGHAALVVREVEWAGEKCLGPVILSPIPIFSTE